MYGGLPKEYRCYNRIYEIQARPYIEGEDIDKLYVANVYKEKGHPKKGDMVRWDLETSRKEVIPKWYFERFYCIKSAY